MASYGLNDSKGNEYILVVTPKPRKHKAVSLTLFKAERNERGKLNSTIRIEQVKLHVDDKTGDLQWAKD